MNKFKNFIKEWKNSIVLFFLLVWLGLCQTWEYICGYEDDMDDNIFD